ncbi:MAG: hybrid sensor histidine kinase/response regulator [Rhodothermales bacterium]
MEYVSDREVNDKARQAVEAAIVTLAACTYAVAFPTMYRGIGPGTGALAVLPVILISWFWGFRVGVSASVMAGLVLNPILFYRFESGADVLTVLIHSLPYFIAVLIIAALTGRLRDVRVRLSHMLSDHNKRQLESEREAREKVEELLKLKSAFLNNMNHELRTPLTGILGFAEILSEEVPPKFQEFALRIVSSGQRLQETLNSILDLAQLEGGSLELEPVVVDVASCVPQSASRYRAQAEKKQVDFDISTPSHRVESSLDRASLDRIVKSLVDNAIKFTDEGAVSVSISSEAGHAVIRVKDTGIGISAGFLPHMFSEFRQESIGTARSYEGSGLGLAITKRLVELMGGHIEVESEQGRGSTFTVAFPLCHHNELHAPVQVTETLSATMNATAARSDTSHRVLILDDNADTLTLTQHQLRGLFTVQTEEDADAALAAARSERFDAVLLDINLGGGHDGVDVLHAIREMDAYKETPIVAMTAYALPGDEDRFLDAGFDGYLSKPFTKQEITDAIRNVLHERPSRPAGVHF